MILNSIVKPERRAEEGSRAVPAGQSAAQLSPEYSTEAVYL